MQLLGLQGGESNLADTQIIAAYEHLSASPLEVGYSKLVEEGRTVLLHAAVDGCRYLCLDTLRFCSILLMVTSMRTVCHDFLSMAAR